MESERKELVNQIGAAQRYLDASGGTGRYNGKEVGQRIESLKQELKLRDELLSEINRGCLLLGDEKNPLMKLLKKTERRQKLHQI